MGKKKNSPFFHPDKEFEKRLQRGVQKICVKKKLIVISLSQAATA
jgi:hypothetical protein